MQLVIDIHEKDYKSIMNSGHVSYSVVYAIKHGIPLDKIRAEIERLHYHPKLDFIKNDEVVGMALDIIDKYRTESEG